MAVKPEEIVWWAKNSKVTVEQAGLYAYIKILESLLTEEEIPNLSYESLIEYLRAQNVTFQVDMVACQQIIMNPRAYVGMKTRIAAGKEPINGKDAIIEILLEDQRSTTPRVLDDGKVDYFDLGIVRTVRKGQLLARKTPATEAFQGVSVSGAPLMGKSGRDYRLPQGKNTVVSEDGLELFADADGHVSYAPQENKINVFDVFTVNGDVDFSIGNIDFLGNVKINGNVLPGFRIVAAGDIEVTGNVDGAILEAGGDIIVRGGVHMRSSKGLLKAGGTVRSRFVQGANVEAGVDVLIRDSIMHCNISAARNVHMEAQKSVVVGGMIRAGEEVRTRTLGSPMATPTEVEVGVHPHLRTEMNQLHERLKSLQQNMDKTKKALALLDNMAGIANKLPPEKEAMRQNLALTYQHSLQEEEELMYRRSEIEATLLDTSMARVTCLEVVHAGVKLTLGQHVSYIRDTYNSPVLFKISDGEIVSESISPYR